MDGYLPQSRLQATGLLAVFGQSAERCSVESHVLHVTSGLALKVKKWVYMSVSKRGHDLFLEAAAITL